MKLGYEEPDKAQIDTDRPSYLESLTEGKNRKHRGAYFKITKSLSSSTTQKTCVGGKFG